MMHNVRLPRINYDRGRFYSTLHDTFLILFISLRYTELHSLHRRFYMKERREYGMVYSNILLNIFLDIFFN
jgi:hypothetical protein